MAGTSQTGFKIRLVSALILAPVVLSILWLGGRGFLALVILAGFIALTEWVSVAFKTRYPVFFSGIGIFYILTTFLCLYFIRAGQMPGFALLFVCMIWGSDTAAYIAGKTLDGPRMSKTISPNKTWTGFTGALIFPAVVMILYIYFIAGFEMPPARHISIALFSGLAVGFVGQVGDLIVSFLKRQAGVKDAGNIIPGHGGLLDRIDSMMLSAPVFLFTITHYSHVFSS